MDEYIMSKIALDSNIFRNQDFFNWLILRKDEFSVSISIIVYLETLFWYLTRSLTVDDFTYDLEKINADIISLDISLAQETVTKAIKSELSFKHHARDFIIGSAALLEGATLLTYNKKHFLWMSESKVLIPEEFVDLMTS